MSSVNVIQFNEPQVRQTGKRMSSGGDPFAEMLDRETAPRKAEERPLDRSAPREEVVQPRSRREARAEAGSRDGVRPAKSGERPAEQSEQVSPNDPVEADAAVEEVSRPEASGEAKQPEGSAALQAGEAAQSSEEVGEKPMMDSGEDNAEAEGATVQPIAAESTEQQQEPTEALVPAQAAEQPAAPAGTVASLIPQDETSADGTSADSGVENAGKQASAPPAPPVEISNEAAPSAGKPQTNPVADAINGKPIPAEPAAAPNSPNAPVTDDAVPMQMQTSAPRPAVANPEQPLPPAQPNGNPAQAAFDHAAVSFENQDGDHPSQRAQEQQQVKQHDVKPAQQVAENAKAPVQAAEPAAPKVQPNFTPEPVRAVANSFNALSTNSVSLHAATAGDRAPAVLNGAALAVEIVGRMRDGMRRFDIRLDPPELGRVEVRLEVDRSGSVKTHMTVDRPETLDLMQREARGLERALQQAGLKTDSGGLEFSLRSHAEHGQPEQRQPRHERHGPFGEEGVERIDVAIEGYRSAALARGGVDIRI